MGKITTKQATVLITTSRGRAFNVGFLGKNNVEREVNGQFHLVPKTSKNLTINPTSKNQFLVFDLQSGRYRFVDLNTINYLAINGNTYEVSNG